jgi:hypothetical protein
MRFLQIPYQNFSLLKVRNSYHFIKWYADQRAACLFFLSLWSLKLLKVLGNIVFFILIFSPSNNVSFQGGRGPFRRFTVALHWHPMLNYALGHSKDRLWGVIHSVESDSRGCSSQFKIQLCTQHRIQCNLQIHLVASWNPGRTCMHYHTSVEITDPSQ